MLCDKSNGIPGSMGGGQGTPKKVSRAEGMQYIDSGVENGGEQGQAYRELYRRVLEPSAWYI